MCLCLWTVAACAAGSNRYPVMEDFDHAPVEPLTRWSSPIGQWQAPAGDAEITERTSHSGRRALRLFGGEDSYVELVPAEPIPAGTRLSFWAERWTRNEPFAFAVDRFADGRWHRLDLGDQVIKVGGFLTHVRIDLADRPVERLRFRCTAPKAGGVLIDDVRLAAPEPMRVLKVAARQSNTPLLIGGRDDPILIITVVVEGELNPVRVRSIRVGTPDADDLAGLSVVYAGREQNPDLGKALASVQPAAATVQLAADQTLAEGSNTFYVMGRPRAEADIDHIIRMQCLAVELDDGRVITPDAEGSDWGQRLGIALRDAGDDGAAVYRIPGLATTRRGTLIGVYDIRHRGGSDLPADIDVGMSRSTDGGRTWEPMKKIIDMGDDPRHRYDGVGDPCVLVDRATGTIWVAALWSHGDRGWNGSGPGLEPEQTGQLVMVRSDDDGQTWSDPIHVTAQIKNPAWRLLLQGPGRGITMFDGTLVFPAQFRDAGGLPHSTILYSKDHGKTWRLGAGAYDDTTEAAVAEIEPGVLMLNCRYNRGPHRVVMITRDMGNTWTEHPTSRRALPEPGACMASLIRCDPQAGGRPRLLFSNPSVDAPPRRHLTIQQSGDLGMSWPAAQRILLDEGNSAGYSCLTMIDAKTIGILYEGSRSHLTFQRILIDDLNPRRKGAR